MVYAFFEPTRLITEFAYTFIVVILFSLIYFKTKEIYSLTKYKGIGYFRIAFLLFGLAYLSRLIFYSIRLSFVASDILIHPRTIVTISMIPLAFLSTLAILFLIYSNVWKQIKYKTFITFSLIVALIISVVTYISPSLLTLSLLQLPLFLATIALSFQNNKKKKSNSHIKLVYIAISFFWLVNIVLLELGRLVPFELKIILQILSLAVFVFLTYKVLKLVK